MSGTAKVDWFVLADEWEQFVEYVDERYVANDRYIRQELESAMEEFIDADGYQGIEERIDRLVSAAGRRPRDGSKNKILSEDAIEDGEKTRVTIWVFADIREQFSIQAKKQSDHNLGVVLSLALREYRQGGRSTRLESKLDRILEDAEGLLSEIGDSGPGSKLGTKEKRTIAIIRHLSDTLGWMDGEPIARTDIHDAIEAVTGSDSEYMREQYTERVIDRVGYVPHPKNPEKLYTLPEDAEEQRREEAEAETEAEMKRLGEATPEGRRAATDGGTDTV